VHHLDDALGADMAEEMMPDVHFGLQCGCRDKAGGEVSSFEVSKRLVLWVVKDGEVDAIASGHSIKDVRSPSLCTTAKELRG
jgi:hypothetical protein